MLATAAVLLLAVVAAPADVSGKWDGKLVAERPDGATREDTALLILTQKDTTITGTIGGNEDDQHPIVSGSIEGDKVTIVARHHSNGREFRLEMTLAGDEMKGTVATGDQRGRIQANRRKP